MPLTGQSVRAKPTLSKYKAHAYCSTLRQASLPPPAVVQGTDFLGQPFKWICQLPEPVFPLQM